MRHVYAGPLLLIIVLALTACMPAQLPHTPNVNEKTGGDFYFANSEQVTLQAAQEQMPWPFLLPEAKLLPADVQLQWVEIVKPHTSPTSLEEWSVALHYSGNIVIEVKYPNVPYPAFVAAKEAAGDDMEKLFTALAPHLQEAAKQERAFLDASVQKAPQIIRKEHIDSETIYIGISGQTVTFPPSEHEGLVETESMVAPYTTINWVHSTGLYNITDWPKASHLQGDDPLPRLRQMARALLVADNFFTGALRKKHSVTTPRPATPTSTADRPSSLLSKERCSYEALMEDAKRLNLPITPIAATQDTPSALRSLTNTPTQTTAYLPQLGVTARLDGYAFEIADYLKGHQQDGVANLQEWLNDRDLLCKPTEECSDNLVSGDFNKDGGLEYILPLTFREISFDGLPNECGAFEHLAQRAYLFSCQTNPDNCDVYRIGRLQQDANHGACLNSVADINNDGQLEALVTYHLCGASDCWEQLEIVSLNSSSYRYLAPKIEVHNGCIAINDENGDGVAEIFAITTDIPGSLGFLYDETGSPIWGPSQQYASIYQWNGIDYRLSGRVYSHDCLFHLIWDGLDWFKRGEIQTSLFVFEMALKNQSIPADCKNADNIAFPWKTYAQFAVGMLNAKLGERQKAVTALKRVEKMDTKKIFVPLVDTFLKVYSTEDFEDACDALTSYVSDLPTNAPFYGPYKSRQLVTFCSDEAFSATP